VNKLKTKVAIAGLLFAAAGSSAFAQYDPNLANRYPGYAEPNVYGYVSSGKLGALNSEPAAALQSAQVRLQKHGNVRMQSAPVVQRRDVWWPTTSGAYFEGNRQFNVDRFDHASSPYAGG
jgi:hypothetical protein